MRVKNVRKKEKQIPSVLRRMMPPYSVVGRSNAPMVSVIDWSFFSFVSSCTLPIDEVGKGRKRKEKRPSKNAVQCDQITHASVESSQDVDTDLSSTGKDKQTEETCWLKEKEENGKTEKCTR